MRVLILILSLASIVYTQAPPLEPGVSHELAKWRAAHYSDVRYGLSLKLEKGSPVLKGTIEVRVNVGRGDVLSVPPAVAGGSPSVILDWRKIKGFEDRSTISNVSINGRVLSPAFRRPGDPTGSFGNDGPPKGGTPYAYEESSEHLIFRDGVVVGENVIKLDFTSPILPSGSAITRYIDKEDGSEYIYSLFVPSDASTAFPVFDQPDLKAKFTLSISAPKSWRSIVTNAELDNMILVDGICGLPVQPPNISALLPSGNTTPTPSSSPAKTEPCEMSDVWNFKETKPISTYVFAFAVGPWERVPESDAATRQQSVPSASAGGSAATRDPSAHADGTNKAALPTSIYVRRSQAAKFKPHAAEVFRLNREGVKFLEQYFDYKFPFPKYDLVLIPEFPFGGMEHAGATFLRETSVIFPQEPTANDYISRANLIFHEAAHQWFGDTVTMRWFDDLWLKEGFAEFMAYKTLERVMPQYNAWKVFYERNKQAAYLTDSTKGTTPIYQEIKNLSAAKSAYGNIVYRKAPSFLKQAEFYIGPDKFQTAVRAFLKKHEFANAGWEDLVKQFQVVSWSSEDEEYFAKHERKKEFEVERKKVVADWADFWVKKEGVPIIRVGLTTGHTETSQVMKDGSFISDARVVPALALALPTAFEDSPWAIRIKTLYRYGSESEVTSTLVSGNPWAENYPRLAKKIGAGSPGDPVPSLIFPNYQDYGYGIFLLDEKSRDYVLKNIQNEKDEFLRSMMWGALWDSVREGELDPKEYVELVIATLGKSYAFTREASLRSGGSARTTYRKITPEGVTLAEDETTVATLLNRVSTAMTYYLPAKQRNEIAPRLEAMLIEKMRGSPTLGQRLTSYRAFLNVASTDKARTTLKDILNLKFQISDLKLKTKDRFDIVTRLASLNDPDAEMLLADLEKTETSDDAKRYAYAARAAFPTKESKEKYWNDFVSNKQISESWIEAAFGPFNSVRHADLTLPYLERALKELPNHKRNRKIFFVNGWLAAFIGGQRSEGALAIVNKFLADNPDLDRDLRLKILENVDIIERAVKIRGKFATGGN